MGHVPFFGQVGMTDVFFWVHALRAYPPCRPWRHQRPQWGRSLGAGRRPGSISIKKKATGTGTKKGKGKAAVPPGPSAASVKFCGAFITKPAPAAAAAPAAPHVRCSKCPTGPARARHLFFLADCFSHLPLLTPDRPPYPRGAQ